MAEEENPDHLRSPEPAKSEMKTESPETHAAKGLVEGQAVAVPALAATPTLGLADKIQQVFRKADWEGFWEWALSSLPSENPEPRLICAQVTADKHIGDFLTDMFPLTKNGRAKFAKACLLGVIGMIRLRSISITIILTFFSVSIDTAHLLGLAT